QVGRDELRVRALVGDDEDLGRAGEQIDADAPEELPLRLGDVCVAGADDHVDRLDVVAAEHEQRERLDAADAEDVVGARGRHRVEHRRVDAAPLPGRCDRDDALDAGDLRRQHGHECGGEHRVAAAGNVRADGGDGNVPVPEGDARPDLDLEL